MDCHDCLGPHGQGAAAANAMLDELLLGSEHFPRQSALARREVLYMRAIDLFEKGQQWEPALEPAEALKRQFASVTFDSTLSARSLLRGGGTTASSAASGTTPSGSFRVAYYGKKLLPELANQEFVYGGAPLEQIIDFLVAHQAQVPGVQPRTKIVPGPEHTDQADKYFMAISKLAPSSARRCGARARRTSPTRSCPTWPPPTARTTCSTSSATAAPTTSAR